ncbi:hypothetical protein [Saccharothrix deserti]|uniref:hypothetical protein n=1 Tax=Saccharothrix deserti TaxID=2593674 RepID=UPI00131A7644|nr:hypothetical protein [Saccharothrix deserti]
MLVVLLCPVLGEQLDQERRQVHRADPGTGLGRTEHQPAADLGANVKPYVVARGRTCPAWRAVVQEPTGLRCEAAFGGGRPDLVETHRFRW